MVQVSHLPIAAPMETCTEYFRSPELLLGIKEYTTSVDVWSIGCIFAELMQKEPLFAGRGEIDQINKVTPVPIVFERRC